MTESFIELIEFAESECGKNQYPKLAKALKSLQNDMIGMKNLKDSIGSEIKTVLAYDLLDKPTRTTPVRTRSRSRSLTKNNKKRSNKKNNYKKKKKSRKNDPKNSEDNSEDNSTNILLKPENEEEEPPEEDPPPENIMQFLKKIQDFEDEEYEEEEEEQSIRSNRMKDFKLHTLLLGAPGTGKTTVARKLASIWEAIGLCNNKFIAISKGHLASKWQGQMLEAIRELIFDYSNGVIFIDEAYSLVTDSKDSYGNEVLSFIVHAMTDPKCTTTFIMAGYAEMIKNNLFSANEGLSRRFNSIFVMEKPNPNEMAQIFKVICNKAKGWKCVAQTDDLTKMFEQSKEYFKDSGGDIEALVLSSYHAHVNRYFPRRMNQRVNLTDIMNALVVYKKSKSKKRVQTPEHLYM